MIVELLVLTVSNRMPTMPNSVGRVCSAVAVVGQTGPPPGETPFCYGLPGAIDPAGRFDPANLLAGRSKADVYRFREAELVHCRVGMLASVGFLVQESFHPMCPEAPSRALDQMPALPPPAWAALGLIVGVAESLRIRRGWANPYESMDNIQRLKPDYYPGDLRFDPLGLYPFQWAPRRYIQNCELSHGRLAMLAAAGFIAQEAVSGQPLLEADSELLGRVFAPYIEVVSRLR